jgi:D-glycero-D-manno-heptose 1,7-bisphosphate phosphatase
MSAPTPHGHAIAAFVLCGGLGTRLRAIETEPKPIVSVSGLPFLFYLFDQLAGHGVRRVHLLLGHGAATIRSRLGLGDTPSTLAPIERAVLRPLDLVPVVESEPLGTGGALAQVRDHVEHTCLLLNGDSYVDADLRALLEFHAGHPDPENRVTLLGVWCEDRSDYGGLVLDEGDRVIGFSEKGRPDAGWINGGIAAIGREVARGLPTGPSSLEQDLYPRLAARGSLHMLGVKAFFCDIGTPTRLAAAQRAFGPLYRRIAQKAVQSPS